MSTITFITPPTPKTKWEEHNDYQLEVIKDLSALIAQGQKAVPMSIEITINPDYDNTLIRDFAIKNDIVTAGQFKEMLRRVKINEELGSIPMNATHLVDIVVKKDKIECQYDGMLTRDVVPYLTDEKTGEKLYYDAESMTDETVRLHCEFHFPKTLNTMEFERQLRILNDNLKLGFSRDAISDAVEQWYENSKKVRLFELFGLVGAGKTRGADLVGVDQMWADLANNVFDTSHDSPDFIIAVLKKFVWQVKRKIRNSASFTLPVTNHLMPVILGPQGKGKTTFVNLFIAPLKELALEVNFKAIEEDRNIDIWKSFILFLDEMGYASKSDVDTIKNAITANTLTRRPMRSNSKVTVSQNATFIGCSNKVLAQLIKDPTGIRRFVGLQFSTNPCRGTMNRINYRKLWLSVDPNQDDPMLPFMDRLQDRQEEDREKGRVEEWLAQFDPNAGPAKDFGKTFTGLSKHGKIVATDLFELYSEWEGVMFPGNFGRLNVNEWGHEMKRLMDNDPASVPFTKGTRSSKGAVYVYSGPENVILVPAPRHNVGYAR
jgi:Virulence-associated protein E